MKLKSLFVLGLLLVSILAMNVTARDNALPVKLMEVEIDDEEIFDSDINNNQQVEIPGLEKANEIEVSVKFTALADLDDVQVEAQIRGYDHRDLIEDITSAFDVHVDRTYTKKLTLDLKERMDPDRVYKLRVIISDRYDDFIEDFTLDIASTEHSVVIRDVIMNPSNGIKAGKALLATVRLQNRGDSEEEDIKVTFGIPELGVSDSDYIDELDAEDDGKDSKSSEELFIRIPQCAEEGTYEGVVEVEYDDGDEEIRETVDIEVLADETCEADIALGNEDSHANVIAKTVVAIGPESQDVKIGAGGVVYPVTITNAGSAKTYTIGVTGGDWGTYRISPTNVVTVGNDETETMYIYVSANDNAAAGEQVFGVSIKAGDKAVKEVTLKANVVESGNSLSLGGLKRALEIGLIVLVVILVILGLVIGFNKLKSNDEDNEEGENYY